ncbi:MAG: hypothetical protein L3J36_08995 [Rhodobacteraceae bacterium]|nr:hypothetical protein [Paracoccaceae bacterium]
MSDVMLKQMRNEETLVSKEISKAITTALNSKDTIKKADEINSTSGGWPYKPSKEMLKLYGKSTVAAWKKLKPKYKNFAVSMSVNSPSNSPPTVTAEAVFDGEWRGGKSVMISTGDTILSLAKKIYGYEGYANQVFEANAKVLGKSCRVLPAGFGLEFPSIWVPNWRNEPKVCAVPYVSKKAVKVKLPAMQTTVDISNKAAATLFFGNAIVMVELEGKAETVAQKKGDIDASFNLKAYEAELKKGFGPLEGGFKVGVKGGSSGSLVLKVFSTKIGGLKFSGNVKLLEGAFEIALGSQPFTTVSKGITLTGTIILTAKIRILPNPKHRKKSPAKESFKFEVSAKEVAVVVVCVVVLAAGGWAIVAGAGAAKVVFIGGSALFLAAS